MDDKRYAVLIDSDNISSKYISNILDEMTKYGVITYKRIYGDWTSPQAGKWKKELMENSITPIQQFRNTVGKNATDSTLIIDAMDILYTKNVDGFCIVSSDGDFTRLASRLLEWVRTKHQGHSGQHVQYLLIWNFYRIRRMKKLQLLIISRGLTDHTILYEFPKSKMLLLRLSKKMIIRESRRI